MKLDCADALLCECRMPQAANISHCHTHPGGHVLLPARTACLHQPRSYHARTPFIPRTNLVHRTNLARAMFVPRSFCKKATLVHPAVKSNKPQVYDLFVFDKIYLYNNNNCSLSLLHGAVKRIAYNNKLEINNPIPTSL